MNHAEALSLTLNFEAAWNAHDMDDFADLFTPDATFIGRFGTFLRGCQEIRAVHQQIHDTIYSQSTLTVGAPEARRLCADVAIIQFHTQLAIPTGNETPPQHIYTVVQAVTVQTGEGPRICALAAVEECEWPPVD